MEKRGNIGLEEVTNDVYRATFETSEDMGRAFVRMQEHYENPVFRGKTFSFGEFRDWYVDNSPAGRRTGEFTYYNDWEGFNVPSHVVQAFKDGRFDPLSKDEKKLLECLKDVKSSKFYVLGTLNNASVATQKHETAHGLFYTNPDYQQAVLDVLREIPKDERAKMDRFLGDLAGYHPDVFDDEVHAYLLDRRALGRNGVSGDGLGKASKKIKAIYNQYFNAQKVDNEEKE